MRLHHLLPTTLLALAAADSIALSSFNPRIASLPPACDKVYNAPIAGCVSHDFQSTCSSACIAGLVAISKAVAASCGDADVAETSIIGVFLLGQGIPALCSNTVVTTVGTSEPPAAQTSSSSAAQTSSSRTSETSSSQAESSSAGIIVDPSATPAKPSSTLSTAVVSSSASSAAASSAAVTSAPAVAASSTASFGLSSTSTSTSTAEAPKKSGKSQLSNSSSGGGSPFDVQATGEAARRTPRGVLALVGLLGFVLMVR
ncbi:uncharacterized protein BDZ99DRAFT_24202 [Mytilinidion resinicola]|uniref:Extracellular membrane protein CFEM domain-containing protein n=1 Tax=Mytilinidion resinicola TaxID=574789 RepID=A0A6A6ZC47_9PEZI|nr:uncharacterized protein BDZ99DRAFT_24202 [Mytilinidion resinicola]KAF2817797.1 hypothetical protein BDZ99DRAFT_24202 [Mytilinidion resinicola]